MSRATNDLSAVRMMIGPAILYASSTALTFVVAVAMMATINPRLTLMALIPLPLVTVTSRYFGRMIHERFERIQEQLSDVSAVTQEALAGVRVIRAYRQEARELARFRAANEEYAERNRGLIRLQGLFFPSMGLFMGMSELAVLWLGSRDVINGRMTIGELVAFNSYLVMLAWPMIAFGWVTNLVQRGRASWQRILAILETPPAIDDRHVTHPQFAPQDLSGAVSFRHLTFRYRPENPLVLEGISLDVEAGQTIAIVGKTGSGKSTLLSLLARLHDPPPGTVLIDGIDVRELPLATLRRAIGFVPQEPFLFSDTIAENVAFGALEAPDEDRVRTVAEIARLDLDVMAFPESYRTRIGERGITLSGGQRQRTAIARALYINSRILVLDDSLSAVDTHTEDEILERLRDCTPRSDHLHRFAPHLDRPRRRSHRRPGSRSHRRAGDAQRARGRRTALCHVASPATARSGAGRVMTHDEEVLGKAYDARLMRRLLSYLRPVLAAGLVGARNHPGVRVTAAGASLADTTGRRRLHSGR